MIQKYYLATIIICFVAIISSSDKSFSDELKREYGLSIHVLPKRVADLDKTGKLKWGFMVSQTYALQGPLKRPIFQDPDKLIEHFKKLSPKIQKNGIWMILTHPDAYSAEEKYSIEKLKDLCRKDNIPLFICRGSELPNGWKRVK